jgi:inner membrane protein involved in colicin E2 resistance
MFYLLLLAISWLIDVALFRAFVIAGISTMLVKVFYSRGRSAGDSK